MKNLKKALSMVLASAMLFGMMVVGTGAAHADVTAEHNKEAIEVVSLAGIMGANEEFNPDAMITRNEMAVVMVNMLGLDTDDFAGASSFTDVPAWAADYVDACYANGIVSGVSATEYNGGANVTTAEAALMVMKALGYFQYASDFENDWLLATVKQASKIDLLDGIEAKASATLTRNEVAQLVLNALKADMVEAEDNGIGVNVNGQLVSKYKYVAVTKDVAAKWNAIDNTTVESGTKAVVQLGEDLFDGKLALDTTLFDDFGRKANTWSYTVKGETTTVKVAAEADFTVLVTGTKNDTLKEIAETLKVELASSTRDASYSKAQVVEIYLDNDGEIEYAIPMTTELAKVTKVVAADKDADYDYVVTLKTETGVKAYKDTDLDGFNAKTMVKDAYVLCTAGTNTAIVAAPQVVTGEQTAHGSGYTKIDGAKLTISGAAYWAIDALNYTDTFDVYCDANGYVVGSVIAEEGEVEYEIFYIDQFNFVAGDKFTADKAQASVINLDGSKAILNVEVYEKDDVKYVKLAGNDHAFADNCITTAGFYAYELNAKGEISNLTLVANGTVKGWKTDAKVTFTAKSAKVNMNALSYYMYADAKTTVTTLKDGKATVVTGYENFTSKAYTAPVLYKFDEDNKEDLTEVYIIGEAGMQAADDTVYGWYVSTGDTYKKDNKTVTDVVYNVEGADKTFTIEGTSSAVVKKLVTIDVTDGIATVAAVSANVDVVIEKASAKYLVLAGNPVYFADDAKIYDVTNVSDNGVVEIDELAANSIITYTVNTKSPAQITAVYLTYAAQEDGVISVANNSADKAYLANILGLNETLVADAVTAGNAVVQYTRGADVTACSVKYWGTGANNTVREVSLPTSERIAAVVFTKDTTDIADDYTYQIICDGAVIQTGSFELK